MIELNYWLARLFMKSRLKITIFIAILATLGLTVFFLASSKKIEYDEKETTATVLEADPYYKIAQIDNFEIFGKKPLYSKDLDLLKEKHLDWLVKNLAERETIYFDRPDLSKESLAEISMLVNPEKRNDYLLDFRGDFELLVYLNSYLFMSLSKEDLNWYEGEENIRLSLSNQTGDKICEKVIPDDGNRSNDQKSEGEIAIEFFCPNLTKGVYKLSLHTEDNRGTSDYIVRGLEINTPYLLIRDKLYSRDPIEIFIKNSKIERLNFYYWITGLEQTITFSAEETTHELKIKKEDKEKDVIYNLLPGDWKISLPKGGIVLSGANFALSKESWFDLDFENKPFRITRQ